MITERIEALAQKQDRIYIFDWHNDRNTKSMSIAAELATVSASLVLGRMI